MYITTSASLDIQDNSSRVHIFAEQGLSGYIIPIEITKDGKPFNISGATALLQIDKNGTIMEIGCIVSDNHVQLPITETLTDICGNYPLQIRLLQGDMQITTQTVIFDVRKGDGDGV